jgi:hypothetical protein
MFTLGLSMGQIFVPLQAAAFATITPAATGRASTMFNTVRQLGGAVGVAILTTAIVAVGPVHLVAGHPAANLTAYRVAFLVAAAVCLLAVPCALSIRDRDAARTIPGRLGARLAEESAAPAGAGIAAGSASVHSASVQSPSVQSPSVQSPSQPAPSLTE